MKNLLEGESWHESVSSQEHSFFFPSFFFKLNLGKGGKKRLKYFRELAKLETQDHLLEPVCPDLTLMRLIPCLNSKLTQSIVIHSVLFSNRVQWDLKGVLGIFSFFEVVHCGKTLIEGML